MADSLKLVLKCIDKDGFGNLYALNQKLDDETLETVKDYFHNYQLEDYKDIMEIEGNPRGWMCKECDVAKVEEILGITDTIQKQKDTMEARQKEADKLREVKNKAMDEIEAAFAGAMRPFKFLKKLLKKADVVYDPQDVYYTDHDVGEGQLFIIDYSGGYIWYIINNGRKDDDYALNNIKTDGKGAVGFRVEYSDHLHDLIKIVSNENIYKGK